MTTPPMPEQEMREKIEEIVFSTDEMKTVWNYNTNVRDIPDRLLTLFHQTLEQERAKYQELLYAVENKHEGETRHETALRYIRQAEQGSNTPASLIKNSPNEP